MVFTTVNYELHSASGTPPFADIVDNGKFYNFGVQAYSALKAHKTIDIHYPELSGEPATEAIIPYHAVLSWSVTKEEGEYTKPEDDFCKSESTPTGGITLLDGTYEFEDDGGYGAYEVVLDKCYELANVTVTVDGTTATLPQVQSSGNTELYGEFGEGSMPVFTTYPAAVALTRRSQDEMLNVIVPTAGSHTVKVTVPNGSEAECGE